MKKSNEHEKLSNLRLFTNKFKFIPTIVKYIFYYFDCICLFFIKKSHKKYAKKQVLILANLGLGDAVNLLSVTDKYRKVYPKKEYEITIMTPKGLDKLFKEETDFDKFITVDFNSSVFNPFNRIALFKKINEENYDILIDAMGITGAAINVYASNAVNAKNKITIVNEDISICPNFLINKVYDEVYRFENKTVSNIEYYNIFANYLSGEESKVKFHKTKKYKIKVELPNEYYMIFPSASADIKKWDYAKYAKIIKKIYNKTKLPVVFAGTSIDLESVNEVIKLIDVPYINIIGKTDMLEFIEVVKKSKFVITNDTSTYHIALNEEVPVAIITGGYTYDRYVTYNFEGCEKYKRPYIIVNKMKCFNCNNNCDKINNEDKVWPCLESITVEYAWKIIEKMIDNDYLNGKVKK